MTLLPLFFLACDASADKESGNPSDTGDTASINETGGESGDTDDRTGFAVTDEESAAAALIGSQLPVSLVLVSFYLGADEGGCPTIVDDGAGTITYTGGCTSSDGTTYAGNFSFVQSTGSSTLTFSGWSISRADLDYSLDGVVNVSSSNVFSGDALAASYRGSGIGLNTQHDYTFASWTQPTSGLFPLPTSFEGSATINGESIAYTGAWSWSDDCTSRPSEGTLIAQGTNATTFNLSGACEECVPWTTDDGLSGEWCRGD
jgi:hypothetical protein